MPHTTASRLRELWARVGTGPEPQDQKSSGTLLTWEFIGGAGGARTHGPGIMKHMLGPAELPPRCGQPARCDRRGAGLRPGAAASPAPMGFVPQVSVQRVSVLERRAWDGPRRTAARDGL